ncbi:unnamed protein product [Ambrosiozyma monospora]|uniref:Unnamed protein product n=1 Tax=Ambrosiozyma monospora TaxID=43982 RepID=A0A9W6YU47_AMBMO|nr:unnamed protein product [Ambrosiozyma monospora]
MVRLLKYCYGLNESPRAFFDMLQNALSMTFPKAISDNCLHVRKDKDYLIYHVDDLLLLTSNPTDFESTLAKTFSSSFTKDDVVDYFIGHEIHVTREDIQLSITQHIEAAVDKLHDDEQKFVKHGSPRPFTSLAKDFHSIYGNKDYYKTHTQTFTPDHKLSMDDIEQDVIESEFLAEASKNPTLTAETMKACTKLNLPRYNISKLEYLSLTGSLQYIASHGRFDIQYYASALAQYNNCPTALQYVQAIQVFAYLWSTRYSYYRYPKQKTETKQALVKVYTDASLIKARGHAGFIITLNEMIVATKSFKIKEVVNSTYNAELIALFAGVHTAMVNLPTIQELGFEKPTVDVYCDNQPLIRALNQAPVMVSKQTTPFLNATHYLHEQLMMDRIDLHHIMGVINPADILTKPLHGTKIQELMSTTVLAKCFQLVIEGKPSI